MILQCRDADALVKDAVAAVFCFYRIQWAAAKTPSAKTSASKSFARTLTRLAYLNGEAAVVAALESSAYLKMKKKTLVECPSFKWSKTVTQDGWYWVKCLRSGRLCVSEIKTNATLGPQILDGRTPSFLNQRAWPDLRFAGPLPPPSSNTNKRRKD